MLPQEEFSEVIVAAFVDSLKVTFQLVVPAPVKLSALAAVEPSNLLLVVSVNV